MNWFAELEWYELYAILVGLSFSLAAIKEAYFPYKKSNGRGR